MANRREQRLRRKAKAKLAAAVAASAKAQSMMPIALAAIRYIAEIDAPDIREPWSIDSRRRELRAVVHQHIGRAPERRAAAIGPVYPQQPTPVVPPTPNSAEGPKRVYQPSSRVVFNRDITLELQRDVELKKRELRLAAQRFGAVANDRGHRMDARPLADAMEAAARALVRAEVSLAAAEAAAIDARRSA